MGANSWSICPRCLHTATVMFKKEEKKIENLYGKVPVKEFDARRATLGSIDTETFRTFREDYEIGIEGGEVQVDYHGQCTRCNLRAVVQESRTFWDSGSKEV